jgi:ubiquinol-cytochrome c reductase cytochrome c subunit
MKLRRLVLRPVVLVPLVAGLLYAATAAGAAPQQDETAAKVERGRELYLTGCSSCHGLDGKGVTTPDGEVRGPTLERAGEALAYYMLSTGRMPLANSDDVNRRKDPAYEPDEIDDLVAYVATLGDGPPIPDVDPASGDLAFGGELYRSNCQACHGAAGSGGALSYGNAAPPVGPATAKQIASVVRTGPGEMPVFGRDVITDEELDSLVRYVRYLEDPDDRGGIALGRLGPIPEGFLVWVLGMGLLIVVCTWIGGRATKRTDVSEEAS